MFIPLYQHMKHLFSIPIVIVFGSMISLQGCMNTHNAAYMEEVLNSQNTLIAQQNKQLLESEKGVSNLYFVGIAADYQQPEMYVEALETKELFDEQFGTKGRSTVLLNNNKTIETNPIVTQRNIGKTLKNVAAKMNTEEDILFLYLNAHGDRGGQFIINYGPHKSSVLTNRKLKHYLDRSAIKWKVIVISACYSGSFIDDLADPYTLVITSTNAEGLSYYQKFPANFSYFSQAFFKDHLKKERSLSTAFKNSLDDIDGYEYWLTKDKRSQPQFVAGEHILQKLEEVNIR